LVVVVELRRVLYRLLLLLLVIKVVLLIELTLWLIVVEASVGEVVSVSIETLVKVLVHTVEVILELWLIIPWTSIIETRIVVDAIMIVV